MNFKISSHSAPHADIARFNTAAAKLEELKQPLSKQLLSLILLAALPKEYESVAQMTIQTRLKDLIFDDIVSYIEAEWQRRQLNKLQQPRQGSANKLSAVKGKGKAPQFQQQKQQGNKNAEAGPSKLPQSDRQQKKRKRVRKGTKGQGHAHTAIPNLPSSGFAQMLNMSRLPIVEDQRQFPPLPTDPARRLINQIVAPQPQQWYERTTHSASSLNQSAPQFKFRVGTPPRQLVGLNGPELMADTRPSVMISGRRAKAVKLAGLHQIPKPKFFNNRHKEETPQKYQGASKPVHRGGDYETHFKTRQLLDLMPGIPQSAEHIRRLEKIAGKLLELSNSDMVEKTTPKIVEIPDTPSDGEDEEMETTPRKRHRSTTPYPEQDVEMDSIFGDSDEPGPETNFLDVAFQEEDERYETLTQLFPYSEDVLMELLLQRPLQRARRRPRAYVNVPVDTLNLSRAIDRCRQFNDMYAKNVYNISDIEIEAAPDMDWWLHGSGCSQHVTGDKSDFVDFTAFKPKDYIHVKTASTPTFISGVGMIILKYEQLRNDCKGNLV